MLILIKKIEQATGQISTVCGAAGVGVGWFVFHDPMTSRFGADKDDRRFMLPCLYPAASEKTMTLAAGVMNRGGRMKSAARWLVR